MTSRSSAGNFEKQCGTSFYHKDWNIENQNLVSRNFIGENQFRLDKIVKSTIQQCHTVMGALVMEHLLY